MKQIEDKREIRQISKDDNPIINIFYSRKLNPESKVFPLRFLADTGAQVTLIPKRLMKQKHLLTTNEKPT